MVTRQPRAMLLQDQIYSFTGLNNVASRCRLRLFLPPQESGHDLYIALLTDDQDHAGTSITHAVETLSINVCRQFNLPPERTVFIEHYDHRHRPAGYTAGDSQEDFARVSFAVPQTASGRFDYLHEKILGAAQWKPIDKQSVEILIGEPLP